MLRQRSAAVHAPQLLNVLHEDASGGLNERDAPSELAPNESPRCWNVVFDERGGVVSRLGLTKLNAASVLPAEACYLYYSAVASALLAYIPTHGGVGKLYKSTDAGVTWAAAYSLFTQAARGAIVDFHGRVVVVNTIDGAYSFPSSLAAPTHTAGGANAMETATGHAVEVWQNKLWIVDGTTATLRWSAIGDELTWNNGASGSGNNALRDVDDEALMAVGVGQGVDLNTKPALLVFKRHSWYRVYDSTSGAYETLSTSGGAAGPLAVASHHGYISAVNDLGIWVAYGIQEPGLVSGKLTRLFGPDGLDVSAASQLKWAAGLHDDRFVYNVRRASASANGLQVEYHPTGKWMTVHKGMSLGPMTVYTASTRKLFALDSRVDSNIGKLYWVGRGGTDDSTAIDVYWQSRWMRLNRGGRARLRRLRAWGRGTFTLEVRTDFTSGQGERQITNFDATTGASTWDTSAWDSPTAAWGEDLYVAPVDMPLRAVCEYASIVITASTTSAATGPPLLGDGTTPQVGVVGFYVGRLDFLSLGPT